MAFAVLRLIEKKVGGQFQDHMTPEQAYRIRCELLTGSESLNIKSVEKKKLKSLNEKALRPEQEIPSIIAPGYPEKALPERDEIYRLIVNNAFTPIIYYDLNGIVLLINAVGAKNLGGTVDDFIGKSH